MGHVTTTSAMPRRSGILARLYGRAQTGWRRVATVAAAGLAIAVGYHVVFGQNGLTAYQQKNRDTRMLDGQLKSLERENELLKGHVERLQNDPSAIEHQAREELHYTRPGEVIYTLPAAPASNTAKGAVRKP
jgi:cell division protein FtsB